jgi:hypothetical protein
MALPGKDKLPQQPFEAGEPPSASVLNAMAAAAFAGGTGANCYVDGTGVYHRQKRSTPLVEKYGVTDSALTEGDSVTVSLWSCDDGSWYDTDEDQEDVYDSFMYQGLTLPAGVMVKIRYCTENSRWEIVWVPWLDGTMAADLDSGSSATVNISDNGVTGTLTAYAPAVLTSGTISSGKHVTAKWKAQAKHWEAVERECE